MVLGFGLRASVFGVSADGLWRLVRRVGSRLWASALLPDLGV